MPEVSLSKIKMNYIEQGEGFPLVFITGLGGKAEYWMDDLMFFRKYFRCICPDNRGMGGSELPAGSLTIKEMAEDVSELLNHLKIEKANVLGVSMGSAIAQELAINHPEKVEKLILSASWAKTDIYMRKLFETFTAQIGTDFGIYIDMMLLWCFGHDFYQKHITDVEAVETDRKKRPFSVDTFYAHCEACIGHDTLARLENIKAKTLLTVGEKDILTPVDFSRVLASSIPNSRLEIFENCGHLHLWEDVGKYRDMAVEFLK